VGLLAHAVPAPPHIESVTGTLLKHGAPLPDFLAPKPTEPDVAKVDLTTPLPGDKIIERKIIVDTAYTKHVEAAHNRRENQEQQSIVDQTLVAQNQNPTATSSPARSSAAAARRNQDQNAQMDQESSAMVKGGRRGRGKGALHEERISALLLPHLKGKSDLAESAAAVIAAAGQDTENGLVFSANDAQQLARDLSKVLQGRTEPFVSVSTQEDIRERLVDSLTASLIKHGGQLSEGDVGEVVRKLGTITTRQQRSARSEEISSLADAMRDIKENAEDPVMDLATFVAVLRARSEDLAPAAIATYEVRHEEPLLASVLKSYPRDPIIYEQKISEFCTNCIPEAHRREYMRSFSRHIVREQSESTERMQSRVTELEEKCRISAERLAAMKQNLIHLVHELRDVHGEQCCSAEEYREILGLDTGAPDFATRFAELAQGPKARARRTLDALPPGLQQADILSFALTTLVADLEAVDEIVAALAKASSEKLSLTLRIRKSWTEFYSLYRKTLEEHGYLERAPVQSPSPRLEEINAAPYAHAAITFALVPTECLLMAIAKASEAMSAFAEAAAKKEDPSEVREVADRERSITEDSAKRYALAGDFGNADAMIAAYNSRFPDFPISTDILSAAKASVLRQKDLLIAELREATEQKTA
jgi:hypothetical protein